jgi:DNA-binding NtrC family response regulator
MAKETRILVVDDEPKICEFLGILLGREGYQTDSACNAADALARIGEN